MKKIICLVLSLIVAICLCACGVPEGMATSTPSENAMMTVSAQKPKITYQAEFYRNNGNMWLSIEGSNFDISPNKTKNYMFDTSGNWTYEWETSSVVSIEIDGNNIESCGSTVLFYDNRLEKLDMEIPTEVILDNSGNGSIDASSNFLFSDYWRLNFWWINYNQANKKVASRLILIQSQEGDPICMFSGDSVSWKVSKNLPKTTEIEIDGMMVYIHRANFAIIDTSIFE